MLPVGQHCCTCGTVACSYNWFVCKSVGNKSNAAAKVQNYFLFLRFRWELRVGEGLRVWAKTVACLSFALHFQPFILAADTDNRRSSSIVVDRRRSASSLLRRLPASSVRPVRPPASPPSKRPLCSFITCHMLATCNTCWLSTHPIRSFCFCLNICNRCTVAQLQLQLQLPFAAYATRKSIAPCCWAHFLWVTVANCCLIIGMWLACLLLSLTSLLHLLLLPQRCQRVWLKCGINVDYAVGHFWQIEPAQKSLAWST